MMNQPRMRQKRKNTGKDRQKSRPSSAGESTGLIKKNFIVLKPNSKISAYDILPFSDLCNTSWGTMGLEIARFGLPVITPISRSIIVTPGIKLFKHASTILEYKQMLDEPVVNLAIEDLIEVCRLYYASYLSNSLYVSNREWKELPTPRFSEIQKIAKNAFFSFFCIFQKKRGSENFFQILF